jgi:hypothetical protein
MTLGKMEITDVFVEPLINFIILFILVPNPRSIVIKIIYKLMCDGIHSILFTYLYYVFTYL